MELRHLRYFVAIVDYGSVSKAAGALNITQPALSRQIRDLERELGVQLFDRVGRRLTLTTAGDHLLPWSRIVLNHVRSLGERADALRDGLTGTLRLAMPPQILQDMARVVERYRRSHPGIEVQLVEEGGYGVHRLLESGQAHLGLAQAPAGGRLAFRPLMPVWILAVTSRARALGRRATGTIEVSDLATEPLMVLRREFGSREAFDAACRAAQLRPKILLESGAPQSLAALAEVGHAIAILPSTVDLRPWKVRAVPISNRRQPVGLWATLAWDSQRYQPPYVKAFADNLIDHFRRSFTGSRFARAVPPPARPPGATTSRPGDGAADRPEVAPATSLSGSAPP